MNTRGKDLSLSDKVKSYLLGLTENQEERDDVVTVWGDIVDAVNDNYDKIDAILQSYRLYLKEEKATAEAFIELINEFENAKPLDTITELKEYAECYLEVTEKFRTIKGQDKRKIFMLQDLLSDQWMDVLSTAKMENVKYFSELLDELVAFYYSYWVGGYTAAKTTNRSIQILKRIKEGKGIEDIRDYIDQKRLDHKVHDRVKESLNSPDVIESWHKRLLVALEYTMATPRVIEKIDLNEDAHREHILPSSYKQAIKEHKYWKDRFKNKFPENLVNSLGNLVLLQYDLNQAIQQKPYPEKIKYYKGEKAPGGKEKREKTS